MKNILIVVILILLGVIGYQSFSNSNSSPNTESLEESSALIQQQLKYVSKLVVSEGHFSEVFTYKNSKALLGNFFTAEKQALVVVNASVSVMFNLRELKYELDEKSKTITLLHLPETEIKIHPDYEYHELKSDFLNKFEAKDYNKIKEKLNKRIMEKVEQSPLKLNAKNRLITELTNIFATTTQMGWTLKHNHMPLKKKHNVLNN